MFFFISFAPTRCNASCHDRVVWNELTDGRDAAGATWRNRFGRANVSKGRAASSWANTYVHEDKCSSHGHVHATLSEECFCPRGSAGACLITIILTLMSSLRSKSLRRSRSEALLAAPAVRQGRASCSLCDVVLAAPLPDYVVGQTSLVLLGVAAHAIAIRPRVASFDGQLLRLFPRHLRDLLHQISASFLYGFKRNQGAGGFPKPTGMLPNLTGIWQISDKDLTEM